MPRARKPSPQTAAPAVSAPIEDVVARLRENYPDARYELEWSTPLEMLVATILAAQCTDERVNKVTAALFPKYPDAAAFADADREELERDIKPTGFFRQKAGTLIDVCRALIARHGGQVPTDMDALCALPGVARKTANVVLASCTDVVEGVIVDTHVGRVSQRLGLTRETGGEKIERDLMRLVPREDWNLFGLAAVLHGRYVCKKRDPACEACVMNDICPRVGVTDEPGAKRRGERAR